MARMEGLDVRIVFWNIRIVHFVFLMVEHRCFVVGEHRNCFGQIGEQTQFYSFSFAYSTFKNAHDQPAMEVDFCFYNGLCFMSV